MTREEIILMAEESTPDQMIGGFEFDYEQVVNFANLVAAAEREACIKLIEDFSKTTMVPVRDTWVMGLIAGANALRARGRDE
jgi:hypothetical protein